MDRPGAGWNYDWWARELQQDPVYDQQVMPLVLELVENGPITRVLLDLGCGEGRVLRALNAAAPLVVGCDLSFELLQHASAAGPVVQARLPDLGWLADDTVDCALAVLVVEHLSDPARFFAATARVVRAGGRLIVVRNHPLVTAPGSAPILDVDDGEVLWRWGDYLQSGMTLEPIGAGEVEFHHQPLGEFLTTAASCGWRLDRMTEAAVKTEDDPLLAMQGQIPRLAGFRFRLGS
jgi:SAM-dependent methyltransferase